MFVRSLKEELSTKTLVKNDFKKNSALFKALNKKIQSLVESTQLPVFIIDSKQQVGKSFAERYENAFATVFSHGFDKVISLGNDVPNLNSVILKDLVQQFSYSDVTYGATKEKGLYALGLSYRAFEKLDFSQIKWQSKELLTSFKHSLRLSGLNYFEHQTILLDINNQKQLKAFIESKVSKNSIYLIFLTLIFPLIKRVVQSYIHTFSDLNRSSVLVHRGPPIVC